MKRLFIIHYRKVLSVLLILTIVAALSAAAAAEGEEENSAFYVVGNSRDLFGAEWEEAMIEDNQMTLNEDGTYTKVYEGVGPIDGVVSLKVTNGDQWIGSPFGGSVKVEVFDNADLTVRYDPGATDSPQVTVSGDGVKIHGFSPWAVDVMRVVGSAQGGFLNDLTWAVDADVNNMTEISYGVYQITFEDIEANDGYQFIFAANGSRDDTFGCSSDALVGRANFAAYDGNTICFDVPEDNSTVTITLDMSQFDLSQEKYDASFTIRVVGPDGTEYISDFDTDVPPTEAPTADDDILGDVDGDGEVSILDATAIQRYLVSLEVTPFNEKAADVDGDGVITIFDATAIQRWLAGMSAPEGIGQPMK